MKTLRTVIYCRVSTKLQDPGLQLTELREYATRRGDVQIIGEFVDLAVSAPGIRVLSSTT